jgi:ATP-dependent RNA helicase RhlE
VVLEQMQLQERVEIGFKELEYNGPTTILENAIPAIMSQKDVLVIGEENEERTLSYLLPLLSNIVSGPHGHLRVLILSATQQSAIKTFELLRKVGEKSRLRSVLLGSREEISEQIQLLRQGAEIVVACPTRLLEVLDRGALTLTNVETLVLDEADQLILQGLHVQVKQIMRRLPVQRQNLLFANSLSGKLQNFAKEVTDQAVVINPGNVKSTGSTSHILYPTSPITKDQHLAEIIHQRQDENFLIITFSIQRASQIISTLKENRLKGTFFDPNRKKSGSSESEPELTERIYITCEPIVQANYREYFDIVIFYDVPKSPQQYIRHTRSHSEVRQSIQFISLVINEETASVRKIERILGKKFEKANLGVQQKKALNQASGRNSNFRGKPNHPRGQNRTPNSPAPESTAETSPNAPKHQNINRQFKKTIK